MPGRILLRSRLCFRFYHRHQYRLYSTQEQPTSGLGLIRCDVHSHQSFHIRNYGPPLPLPPSLDPLVIASRSLWKEPKERPNVDEFTPFQKKLWENPYAHTLATPLRMCRVTSILLPDALLTTLHPRPHPVTKAPWLLPVSLTTTQHHLGPPYRFLSHKYVTTYLSKSKRFWGRSLGQRLLAQLGRKAADNLVWREDMPDLILDLLRKKLQGKLKWAFSQPGQLTPCASPHGSDIDAIDDVSSILYLKTLKTPAIEDLHTRVRNISADLEEWAEYTTRHYASAVEPHKQPGVTHRPPSWYTESMLLRVQPRLQYPPLEYKTTLWRGRKVAVHSLVDLLGEERARELVSESRYEAQTCLVLRRARHNVPVEMLLMKLAGYLAEPAP